MRDIWHPDYGLWHLEHRNGRVWTESELDAVVCDYRKRMVFVPAKARCDRVFLDIYCVPFLIDTEGDLWPCTEDMLVVWNNDAAAVKEALYLDYMSKVRSGGEDGR